jgi:superfamily II DNA or RNA helicase
MKLRKYQKRLLEKIKVLFQIYKAIIAYMPTGGGKTELAIALILESVQREETVLFVVNREPLVEQTRQRMAKYGVDAGVIKCGYPVEDKQVQIAMIQTWNRRPKLHKAYDLVIVDECHGATADIYNSLFAQDHKKILGLTATPYTDKNKKLADRFEAIVSEVQTDDLVKEGYLVKPICYTYSPRAVGLDDIGTTRGEYDLSELNLKCNNPEMIRHLYNEWEKHGDNRQTLAFCVNVDHAQNVERYFNLQGVLSEVVTGETPLKTRLEIYEAFRNKEIKLIASVMVLSEGFDMPEAEVGLMARPTKSFKLWIQQIGRLLRIAPDKQNAIIIDQGCNMWRFGHPLEKLELGLDVGYRDKKDRGEAPYKHCTECHTDVPAGSKICPVCGAEFVSLEDDDDGITLLDNLVQINASNDFLLNRLIAICEFKGYKKGWVAHNYLSKAINPTMSELSDVAAYCGYKKGWIHYASQKLLSA